MARARVADFERNLDETPGGFTDELLSANDTLSRDELQWRHPSDLFEHPRKVEWTQDNRPRVNPGFWVFALNCSCRGSAWSREENSLWRATFLAGGRAFLIEVSGDVSVIFWKVLRATLMPPRTLVHESGDAFRLAGTRIENISAHAIFKTHQHSSRMTTKVDPAQNPKVERNVRSFCTLIAIDIFLGLYPAQGPENPISGPPMLWVTVVNLV